MNNKHTIDIIGKISTPFVDKFGIPRQPNLCHAKGSIRLLTPFNDAKAVEGLTQHSHIWLLFLFDQNIEQGWKASVRPPRLGGNEKLGVFATRSSFRPNAIGMSVVKLVNVEVTDGETFIHVEGVDLVSGTPIVDIKPYIPYSDEITDASSTFAQAPEPLSLAVTLTENAINDSQRLNVSSELIELALEVLRQDPRPPYKKNKVDNKIYGVKLEQFDFKWTVTNDICEIVSIEKL